MFGLSFHPDIYTEVQDAYSWYEAQSMGLGDDFITELESAFLAIEKLPLTWPLLTNKIHRYILKRFPYGILYLIDEETIFVIAVMHLKRKPGYWENRTK